MSESRHILKNNINENTIESRHLSETLSDLQLSSSVQNDNSNITICNQSDITDISSEETSFEENNYSSIISTHNEDIQPVISNNTTSELLEIVERLSSEENNRSRSSNFSDEDVICISNDHDDDSVEILSNTNSSEQTENIDASTPDSEDDAIFIGTEISRIPPILLYSPTYSNYSFNNFSTHDPEITNDVLKNFITQQTALNSNVLKKDMSETLHPQDPAVSIETLLKHLHCPICYRSFRRKQSMTRIQKIIDEKTHDTEKKTNFEFSIDWEAMKENDFFENDDETSELCVGKCGHVYCSKCVSVYILKRKKCPVCNRHLTPKLIRFLYI